MKKIAIIFILSIISITAFAQTKSYKRGVGTNNIYPKDLASLAEGLSWFYNWGIGAPGGVADVWEEQNIEFIPMAWGRGIEGEDERERLREFLREHPGVKYILGFNEPNFTTQANMTPARAAELWPYIEEIADEFDLTIVGPAPNYCDECVSENGIVYFDPIDYYDAFFEACPDCHVDHVAIHLYMPSNLSSVINNLKKYNKPIWLTEFNYNRNGNGTEENQINFMVSEIEYLEKEPLIYRYAWFMARSTARVINLLDFGEGNLREMGEVYVNMSSFDESYYFSVDQEIPAEHYIASSKNISLGKTTDTSGKLNVKDVSTGRWMEYLVDVDKPGDYYLNMRIACNDKGLIQIYSDDELVTDYVPASTGGLESWGTINIPVTLKSGKQTLKIRSGGRMFYFNWMKISQTPVSSIQQTSAEDNAVKIIPNPVSETFRIDSKETVETIQLYTLDGKQILNTPYTESIDIAAFPEGMYIMKIQFTDGKSCHKQIIKN